MVQFATRIRRKQRLRQKTLNTFAILFACIVPIYPVFGSYLQDYTGAVVRWDIDTSTIIATYNDTTGVDIPAASATPEEKIELQKPTVIPAEPTPPEPPVPTTTNPAPSEPAPTPSPTPVEDPKKPLYIVHSVAPKETLADLSRRYNIRPETIKKTNPGMDTDLKIDQKVVIPTFPNIKYVVTKGDTLSDIGEKFGTKTKDISLANELDDSKIRIGQALIIPNPTKNLPQAPVARPQTNTSKASPAKKNSSSSPRTLTYGSYSLDLKVENGCRNFAWGNCTCFVAKYKKVTWRGNAKKWYKNAADAGVPVGQEARPGAIIVYDGYGFPPAYGHVGIVMEVHEDGTLIIKDMNYAGLNVITTRTDTITNKAIKGYIYAE